MHAWRMRSMWILSLKSMRGAMKTLEIWKFQLILKVKYLADTTIASMYIYMHSYYIHLFCHMNIFVLFR